MVNLQSLSQSWFIYPIMVWSLIWKGLALWRAAKNNQKYWFMVLLVVNTVGILEIIYLKFFQTNKFTTSLHRTVEKQD